MVIEQATFNPPGHRTPCRFAGADATRSFTALLRQSVVLRRAFLCATGAGAHQREMCELRLDQDHDGLWEHTVVLHRLTELGALHCFHEGVDVGDLGH